VKLLSATDRSHVFSAIRLSKTNPPSPGNEVIIKGIFQIDFKGRTEVNEFNIQRILFGEGYRVAELYPKFETMYYRCYPMEKLDHMLSTDVYKPNSVQGFTKMIHIAKGILPIVLRLHEMGFLYLDFSPGNIAEHKGRIYLLDFGEMEVIGRNTRITRITTRYGSRHVFTVEPATIVDDYESLGFVLLDICFGMKVNKIRSDAITFQNRYDLIDRFRQNNSNVLEHRFFRDYFDILINSADDKLDNEYKKLFDTIKN
jgi:serine/threonine protein kinase